MRKVGKNPKSKAQHEADKLLQQYLTKKNPRCECCGSPVYCGHHFIEKSKSNILRYDLENLIPVCLSCHSKFHNQFGFSYLTYNIIADTIKRRGQKWHKYIEQTRHKIVKTDLDWYNSHIQRLTKLINGL